MKTKEDIKLWEVEYEFKGTTRMTLLDADSHLDAKKKFEEGNVGRVVWCREMKACNKCGKAKGLGDFTYYTSGFPQGVIEDECHDCNRSQK